MADRITASVQEAYAPAVAKAKQADSQARRAAELERTARTLAADKKRLEEALQAQQKRFAPLLEMERLDPDAAKSVLRQVRERLDLAKVRQEFVRRVTELPQLAKNAAGAVMTLAKRGVAALAEQGGRMDKVDWQKVEAQAAAGVHTRAQAGPGGRVCGDQEAQSGHGRSRREAGRPLPGGSWERSRRLRLTRRRSKGWRETGQSKAGSYASTS